MTLLSSDSLRSTATVITDDVLDAARSDARVAALFSDAKKYADDLRARGKDHSRRSSDRVPAAA